MPNLEDTTKKKDIPFLVFSINVCQWGGLFVCLFYLYDYSYYGNLS